MTNGAVDASCLVPHACTPAMQSVDTLSYDDGLVPAVLSREAASARVVNAAEKRFWHGRRLAIAATNNQ